MRFSPVPRISVILPAFNRARHIVNAMESVLCQTFHDWELIIVDDGSSDNTFSTIDPYLMKTRGIRYMKHNNRKPALSRNAGIQAAFGRYITFLDSDDHYLPEHLENRIGILEKNPDISLLSGGFLTEVDIRVKDRHNPEKLVNIRECILAGTLFGRRELFIELGGFRNIDYAEDTDLWERASTRYGVMKIEDPKTYFYRRAEDSITLNY
ncbi:MAG: glycosyltransferase family 2 protein [Chlorobiaceae bacterium]|nr:glycosyltransferase family 2 protein [Chlorobiaceae bacterium]NTV60385.1 glycosyltransferase family 2 protein [Chlorobiaceae bacterium]